MREAEYSQALKLGHVGEMIAFDQDEESLSLVNEAYGQYGVKTIQGSVRHLLAGKKTFHDFDFDFVYAAGLYDYLTAPIGTRLVNIMFDSLRPGGKMLIANFAHNIPDVGYMESYMDWWLIYRNEQEMRDLFKEIPQGKCSPVETFTDPLNNIIFAMVTKI